MSNDRKNEKDNKDNDNKDNEELLPEPPLLQRGKGFYSKENKDENNNNEQRRKPDSDSNVNPLKKPRGGS